MGHSSSTVSTPVLSLDVLARVASSVDPAFDALPKYLKSKWSGLMLSNLFRRISYKELCTRSAKLLGKVDVKSIWRAVIADGYVVKNIKVWLFWCVKRGLRGEDALMAGVRFGIHEADRGLRLNMSADLKSHLAKLARNYASLSVEALDKQVVTIFKEMRDWLGKFVYRKMRFVYEQQGLAAWDMQMEVFSKGIHALYLQYPRIETKLHATNIVKSAAHNYGINIIIQATNESKARLVRNGDNTFVSRVVNLDDIAVVTTLAGEDTRPKYERRHDLNTTFNSFGYRNKPRTFNLEWLLCGAPCIKTQTLTIADEMKKLSRRQRIMMLLMGAEDPEFTTWLNTSRHRIRSTCSDYLDKADPTRFMNLAFEFLKVDPKLGNQFVSRLRKRLHAYSQ
jgi:hypothetical protein